MRGSSGGIRLIYKAVALVPVATFVLADLPAGAIETPAASTMSVARVIIYPGQAITDSNIEERAVAVRAGMPASQGGTRERFVGKVARRTFLPGQMITLAGIREPDVVLSGKPVVLNFNSGELSMTARGLAMQAGAVGDSVSVQNSDSGLIVRGIAQADGSVLVGE